MFCSRYVSYTTQNVGLFLFTKLHKEIHSLFCEIIAPAIENLHCKSKSFVLIQYTKCLHVGSLAYSVTKGTTTALARDILTSTQMNMEKRIGNAVTSCSSTFWQATLEVWSSTPLEQNTGGKLNPKEFWHFTRATKS